ncbi:MAG: haloacid dehalogenase-like hydrolase [Thermoplasmata archaeon]|nr:haloacid dehalogenase-like hydrolase [Thermoplasmata archaeon]
MPQFPYRLVTVDIDGTLTRVHGWRVIARALGCEAEFDATNRRFFAHEISEDDHLRNLLDLAVGRTVEDVERILEATPLVDGIRATVTELHDRSARVALLSHNPAYIVDWYRHRFGFDDAEGTDGVWTRGHEIIDGGPIRADKRTGLRRLAARSHAAPAEVAHVGDGWADAALFPYVGAGIAFNSVLPEVERAADVAVRAGSLHAIVPVLGRLRPRPVMESVPPSGDNSNTPTHV